MDQKTISGEINMGMPVKAYCHETEHGYKFASHWSTISDHYRPVRLFAEQDVALRIAATASERDEAVELLTAVTQSDGKVSDLLWNQIQAALKKWGES